MSNCKCDKIYNFIEFELFDDQIYDLDNESFFAISIYNEIDENNNINKNKSLNISTLFEYSNNNKYYVTSNISYILSPNKSDNSVISNIVELNKEDKNSSHELILEKLYKRVVSSKLIKNYSGNDIKEIMELEGNNSISIKLWNEANKKYAALTISSNK